MLPGDLLTMTWKDVVTRLYGIEKKRIEEKRNVRDLAYTVHVHAVESKHRMNVFDFMPLPGDPSKEEIIRLRKIQEEREAKELMAIYERAQLLIKANA